MKERERERKSERKRERKRDMEKRHGEKARERGRWKEKDNKIRKDKQAILSTRKVRKKVRLHRLDVMKC